MRSNGNSPDAPPTATAVLGAAVRARRRSLGLDQAVLAQLAGVGLAFLYELEHGKPTVRIDKVLSVLAVLGLTLELRPGHEGIALAPALVEAKP